MKQWIIRATGILILNMFLLEARSQSEIYEIRVFTMKSAKIGRASCREKVCT